MLENHKRTDAKEKKGNKSVAVTSFVVKHAILLAKLACAVQPP